LKTELKFGYTPVSLDTSGAYTLDVPSKGKGV